MSLDKMIAPMTARDFADTYWERKSFFSPGDPGRFADLFSIKDIGRLLHYLKPSPPEGMLLVKGSQHYGRRWTNADGTPRPTLVRAALQEGYSLVVNGLDKLWEPVERFTHALQAELHHPVDVNLYVTPPGTQAFSDHWDIMDVFILQVEGSKAWQVREAAVDRPLPDEHAPVAADKLPPLVFDGELHAGGMLYIPRGHVHSARTMDTVSIHLSVGIHPKTWIDLFSAAINAVRSDSRFRGALPPGYFDSAGLRDRFEELAASLPALLDAELALGHLAQSWFVDHSPPPGDDFLAGEPELTADTVVRVRDGVICQVFQGAGYAGIRYSGGRIAGPAKIGPALDALRRRRRSTIRELDEKLSAREAVVLVRRLIRDGLLEVEGAGAIDG